MGFYHRIWYTSKWPLICAIMITWPGDSSCGAILWHDDVIKWKHFRRYWPFVRGIHRLPVNSPHKGQGRGVLMFSLICTWINGWVNNREVSDLRRHHTHYDVTVMNRCRNENNNTTNGLVNTWHQIVWCEDLCVRMCMCQWEVSRVWISYYIP